MLRQMMVQRTGLFVILACAAINVGTMLALSVPPAASLLSYLKRGLFGLSAFFGLQAAIAWRRFLAMQKGEQEGNYNSYLLEAKGS